ncbi:unnamed protein product [Lasius platythorax]|uniref:Uncharacterized protein n=1 Tax=Lasius platythorax TaxID=488582 RepID=A0AAV2N5G3_9HYME
MRPSDNCSTFIDSDGIIPRGAHPLIKNSRVVKPLIMIFPNPFPPVGFIQYGLKNDCTYSVGVHTAKAQMARGHREQELTIVVKDGDGAAFFVN